MIDLDPHADGVVLPVRAYPGSRQNALRGEHDGALKIGVTQVAEKGKANKAIVGLLAAELGLKKSQLQLVSGHATSLKRFLVRGVDANGLQDRIDAALGRRS